MYRLNILLGSEFSHFRCGYHISIERLVDSTSSDGL